MARIRIAFSKEDPVRWLSHLDTQKAFERALRRAQISLVFSEGYNPHPKISFASALAVGVISLGEYVDVEIDPLIENAELVMRLQKAMPEGFRIIDAEIVPPGQPALMALVNRAQYRVKVPLLSSIEEKEVQDSIQTSLDLDSWLVERESKKGLVQKEIRSGVYEVKGTVVENHLLLEMLVQTGSEGNVRPEEVLSMVVQQKDLPVQLERLRIIRLGLFVVKDGKQFTPLEVLKDLR
ncbi:TIGR03936 family radical SAM-associated protein [Heliorestis convoluta]|uniref:Radical SAM-linked protein n=1 Tax=Heliorestis convoluta TaxID=356322 RepID=A0A5Q2N0E5_9FIRM|nr:TIGR03936 family radical SAM-associated protein [Heliorestis convoluta]QGG47249.1 Putative radical SAM-linked protein [Heliorestis convoluta]